MIDLLTIGRGAPPVPRTTGRVANTSTKLNITVRLRGENTIFGGLDKYNQSVYVDYTKDSTPEDPIVRISGDAFSGSYDRIVHINDIDPRRASYAELCALIGHKTKTGEYKGRSEWMDVLPVDVEPGDVTKPQNLINKIKASISKNRRYGCQEIYQVGERLLAFYEDIIAKKEQAAAPPVSADSLRDYASHKQSVNSALQSFLNTPSRYSVGM